MKHGLGMLIGCGLSLIAIYALPVLGVGSGVTLAIFLFLMLACHHFMGHGSTQAPRSDQHDDHS